MQSQTRPQLRTFWLVAKSHKDGSPARVFESEFAARATAEPGSRIDEVCLFADVDSFRADLESKEEDLKAMMSEVGSLERQLENVQDALSEVRSRVYLESEKAAEIAESVRKIRR